MGFLSHCCKQPASLMMAAMMATALPFDAPLAELDLDKLLAPVIALEARIPDDARSAETLGTVRGGTGVIIDATGLVLTVGYLILEASSVDLLPNGLAGERVPADVVAWDEITGLGLLRSRRPLGIKPMPLGSSADLGDGDAVITVGWERIDALLPSVIVERRPYAGYWEYMIDDALYVSPTHPAFPGAALISLDGKLAGIGGFAHTDLGDENAVVDTVFIPIDVLKPVLADLLLAGRSSQSRAWLGLYCEESDGELRVHHLPANGPAVRAGILPGDFVLAVGHTPVKTLPEFYRNLWSTVRPGERVTVKLRRGEDVLTVEVQSMDRHEWYAAARPKP